MAPNQLTSTVKKYSDIIKITNIVMIMAKIITTVEELGELIKYIIKYVLFTFPLTYADLITLA